MTTACSQRPMLTRRRCVAGAYCILDDRPRDGISYNDTRFLQEMSKTIMNHLISIRAQAENLRSIQMVGRDALLVAIDLCERSALLR